MTGELSKNPIVKEKMGRFKFEVKGNHVKVEGWRAKDKDFGMTADLDTALSDKDSKAALAHVLRTLLEILEKD